MFGNYRSQFNEGGVLNRPDGRAIRRSTDRGQHIDTERDRPRLRVSIPSLHRPRDGVRAVFQREDWCHNDPVNCSVVNVRFQNLAGAAHEHDARARGLSLS